MIPNPKIVLDTNVVLDAFVFCNPALRPVVSALEQGHLQWMGTRQTMGELEHVLHHARLGDWEANAAHVLTLVFGLIRLIGDPDPLALNRWRCSDPSDQKFIDLAVATGSRWLLTRDRAVLKLARKLAPAGLLIQVPERWALGDVPKDGTTPQA